jgi:hypothetical protein
MLFLLPFLYSYPPCSISNILLDDAKYFETVRDRRWSDGILCPHGRAALIIKHEYVPVWTEDHVNISIQGKGNYSYATARII